MSSQDLGSTVRAAQRSRAHFLFRNPMTVKRFPELAVIPQDKLAAYFDFNLKSDAGRTGHGGAEAEGGQQSRLMPPSPPAAGTSSLPLDRSHRSCGQPSDSTRSATGAGRVKLEAVSGRRGGGGRQPFLPCNPSEARRCITTPAFTVFHGADYDGIKTIDADARRRHFDSMRQISARPFAPSCPSEARNHIQIKVFQNSASEDVFEQTRLRTFERSRRELEKYTLQKIGRVKTSHAAAGGGGDQHHHNQQHHRHPSHRLAT